MLVRTGGHKIETTSEKPVPLRKRGSPGRYSRLARAGVWRGRGMVRTARVLRISRLIQDGAEFPDCACNGAPGVTTVVSRGRAEVMAHPIQIILMRQLAGYLNVPLFLVDPNGDLLFYNEPAEAILGRRFDETGAMTAEEWSSAFTPEDYEGRTISPADVPLMIAITKRRPAYRRFFIRGLDGIRRHVEVAAIPIAGLGGEFLGAAALFWEVSD
jgi:PAS domain-containing protein